MPFDIQSIPFSAFLGIRSGIDQNRGLLALPDDPRYRNHLGMVHASALFSLAEMSSSEFLLRHLDLNPQSTYALVRHADIRYLRPAWGMITSRGFTDAERWHQLIDNLTGKQRGTITVNIVLENTDGGVVANASFDWIIRRHDMAVDIKSPFEGRALA